MDHKAWPWKKKSMEKTVVESNGISSNGEVSGILMRRLGLMLGEKMDVLCSFM